MTVELKEQNNVLTLTLSRPQVRNAFNDEMIVELTETFRKISTNKSARVLILQGEGESFCAGADLHWMKSMVNFSREDNIKDSKKLYDMFAAMESISFPIIGRIHGHVMGGALGLVSLCDIVAAESETQFCFSEVRLGLAPAVISSFVLKKMPRHKIHRFFLTGEVFRAEEASELGLSHFSGSLAEVDEFVQDMAKKISRNGPQAVRETKKLIQKISSEPNPDYTIDLIADLRVSSEGQEGLKAFFEKRKPTWISPS